MPDPSPKKPNKITTSVSGRITDLDVEVNNPVEEVSPERRKFLDERKRKRREEREARERAAGKPTLPETPPDDKPSA